MANACNFITQEAEPEDSFEVKATPWLPDQSGLQSETLSLQQQKNIEGVSISNEEL